jgi:hypothetical protein
MLRAKQPEGFIAAGENIAKNLAEPIDRGSIIC